MRRTLERDVKQKERKRFSVVSFNMIMTYSILILILNYYRVLLWLKSQRNPKFRSTTNSKVTSHMVCEKWKNLEYRIVYYLFLVYVWLRSPSSSSRITTRIFEFRKSFVYFVSVRAFIIGTIVDALLSCELQLYFCCCCDVIDDQLWMISKSKQQQRVISTTNNLTIEVEHRVLLNV